MSGLQPELASVLAGTHTDPHRVLGVHPRPDGSWVVRYRHPTVAKAAVVTCDGARSLRKVHPAGLFEAAFEQRPTEYAVEVTYPDGTRAQVGDAYRCYPTLGPLDVHLVGEGTHRRLWEVLGAHVMHHAGADGARFAVWAPNARAVRVVGDWNGWDGRVHPMRMLGAGVWELFIPMLEAGAAYKFELVDANGRLVLKADPMAREAEVSPATASVVNTSAYRWADTTWVAARDERPFDDRISVYEVHLGSWRRVPEEDNRPLGYRESAPLLAQHCVDLGFTHVELLPVAEHPFGGSWGYQVTGYYAPTSRWGTPDDFRYFVDTLHQHGIGVIVDWVPAHFPRDDWALGRFDGTALYEHADPRQGEHPDWGTFVYNFGRTEVRNFLLANALYWLEDFHVDGLRVDAVASMLYLDYSREGGSWVPNVHGGRENLEAIGFLQEFNKLVHGLHPGVMTIAEESTAWPGVSRPVEGGGLGFTHKWNMGWMHDTLSYFSKDPIFRSWDHDKLTFGLIYAWHENFVSPLSHDEVVHGKGSLIAKMPGDQWQRFANLRALYAWMWAHPGKQLLFMGGELGQEREWAHEESLDWHLLELPEHRGVLELVSTLNRVSAAHPALWSRDFAAEGFRWLDASDRAASVYVFARSATGDEAPSMVCAANLTPVPRPGYRVGIPAAGRWSEVLNSDDARFGGSGVTNGEVVLQEVPWHGCARSAVVTLPPLGVIWLARR
ncbi:MAG: 1,4-alpha-glucan branching protein GlgB [Acidimicrobiia bacterium]|nr:1,4-alpha-glucan branching protein GlgB [Acidimicrobiia bacterium]